MQNRKPIPLPSLERINEVIEYDPISGQITYRKTGKLLRQTCKQPAINIDGKNYKLARVLWKLLTGNDPADKLIDHISGNPQDARGCNLREATPAQNGANKPKPRNNKSGFKGVYAHRGRYRAMMASKYLGTFETAFAASLAYRQAAIAKYGEYARWD